MDGYLRFVLALIFVIALIGLLAVLSRRLGFGFPVGATKFGEGRRIQVVEVSPLDSRRKLVLIRRDDVEHLLVISPTSEVVIEQGIRSEKNFRTALTQTQEAPLAASRTPPPDTPDRPADKDIPR
ncbi:MAG: flagellar biosynthetic protein FliO [Rhodospirillales bacterium]